MSEALVRAAFESRLSTWAAAQSPAISVAWQNVKFSPTANTRYIRAFVLPARTISLTLDRTHRQYKGVFQASLCMPIDTGAGAAEALVASLDAYFPLTTYMTQGSLRVYLISPMSAAPAISEPGLYVVPVSAQYQADAV